MNLNDSGRSIDSNFMNLPAGDTFRIKEELGVGDFQGVQAFTDTRKYLNNDNSSISTNPYAEQTALASFSYNKALPIRGGT